jgi:hypothetical protein
MKANYREKVEEEFDKKWELYVGEGGFHIGCYECSNGADKEEIKTFILALIHQVERDTLEGCIGEFAHPEFCARLGNQFKECPKCILIAKLLLMKEKD